MIVSEREKGDRAVREQTLHYAQTKYGCYLIVPLKYDEDSFDYARLEGICTRMHLRTMDVNENVKSMFNGSGELQIGAGYAVPRETLLQELCAGAESAFCRVTAEGNSYEFRILPSYLYVFHTQTAFLCLGLSFARMEALSAICNPGYAENGATYAWVDGEGKETAFSLEERLASFCSRLGLRKFFDGHSPMLLEAYTYMLALTPQAFETLEEIRRITFNLHQMMPLEQVIEDESEADIRYVYAVKNQERGTYRWGCCVASQTISYVVADPELELEREMQVQAEDGLPIVILSMYEKYTCLRFGQLLSELDMRRLARMRQIKGQMLRFQAFGTVSPANLSRWNNVRQIYAYLLEVNDIPTAVQDISFKLNILSEHQQANEHRRNETIVNLITIFGIVSILASVLSIMQILAEGDALVWAVTGITSLSLAAAFGVALLYRK